MGSYIFYGLSKQTTKNIIAKVDYKKNLIKKSKRKVITNMTPPTAQVLTAADRFTQSFQNQPKRQSFDINSLMGQNYNSIFPFGMPMGVGVLPYLPPHPVTNTPRLHPTHQIPHALQPFTPEKRQRTVFSITQLDELEKIFALQKYVVGIERTELAMRLRLTESQVKVWFQNRRIKARKNLALKKDENGNGNGSLLLKENGSPRSPKKPSAYEQAKKQLAEEFAACVTGVARPDMMASTNHSTPTAQRPTATTATIINSQTPLSKSLTSSPISSLEELPTTKPIMSTEQMAQMQAQMLTNQYNIYNNWSNIQMTHGISGVEDEEVEVC